MAASNSNQLMINPQRNSRLLQLPAEILNPILEHLFDVPYRQRNGAMRIVERDSRAPTNENSLNILRTCQLVHNNFAGLFYHMRPLESRWDGSRTDFRNMIHSLRPNRLRSIHSLVVQVNRLKFATGVCRLLHHLPGLENILIVYHAGVLLTHSDLRSMHTFLNREVRSEQKALKEIVPTLTVQNIDFCVKEIDIGDGGIRVHGDRRILMQAFASTVRVILRSESVRKSLS